MKALLLSEEFATLLGLQHDLSVIKILPGSVVFIPPAPLIKLSITHSCLYYMYISHISHSCAKCEYKPVFVIIIKKRLISIQFYCT